MPARSYDGATNTVGISGDGFAMASPYRWKRFPCSALLFYGVPAVPFRVAACPCVGARHASPGIIHASAVVRWGNQRCRYFGRRARHGEPLQVETFSVLGPALLWRSGSPLSRRGLPVRRGEARLARNHSCQRGRAMGQPTLSVFRATGSPWRAPPGGNVFRAQPCSSVVGDAGAAGCGRGMESAR